MQVKKTNYNTTTCKKNCVIISGKQFAYILLFLLVNNVIFAQTVSSVDSLELIFNASNKDTAQLNILNKLSLNYLPINADKSLMYGKKAVNLAKTLKNKKKIALAYLKLGEIYSQMGDYDLSLKSFNKSLVINLSLGLKSELFKCYNSIGAVYRKKGDYVKSAEFAYKALNASETLMNKAIAKGNLAIIFNKQGKYNQALKYFLTSLKIFKTLKDENKITATLMNIGNIYLYKGEYDFALDYFFRSLLTKENKENKKQLAICKSNIGVVYHNQKKYKEALNYFNLSLLTFKELNDKLEISRIYNNIGSIYFEQKKYVLAKQYYFKSLKMAKIIKANELIEICYQNLAELFSTTKQFEEALNYYKLFSQVKDSISSNEVSIKIAGFQSKYELAKKEKEIESLKKEKIKKELQIRRRTIVIYLILFSVLILLSLLILFIRNSKLKRKIYFEKEQRLTERIKIKERELSSTANYIANKNEILLQTKEELQDVIRETSATPLKLQLKSITNNLDKNLNVYNDWQKFKSQFDEVYPNFINKLLNQYQNISHNDLKLCVYIKMGISTKEIASLQNLSTNGVKSAKKRLKHKLGLSSSKITLSAFLREF